MTSSNEKTTILYVEDNLDNRVLVRRILMSENYAVLEAVNAADALNILKIARPDFQTCFRARNSFIQMIKALQRDSAQHDSRNIIRRDMQGLFIAGNGVFVTP